MKKVLIATTNKDKYSAVKKIFEATIFKKDEYSINCLEDIDANIIEHAEEGNNIQRAKVKALDAYEQLKKYNYDYYVGLDDAIRIKGVLRPNIKDYLKKVLYENYIDDNEEYSFNRAYCIISNDKTIYETTAEIPYIYRASRNIKIKDFTYPLSKVAYPIGYNKPICDLNEDEELDYYLKYVKERIESLNIK